MGILWAIVWFLVVKNSPAEDPNISEEERLYIETSLANDDQKKVLVKTNVLYKKHSKNFSSSEETYHGNHSNKFFTKGSFKFVSNVSQQEKSELPKRSI